MSRLGESYAQIFKNIIGVLGRSSDIITKSSLEIRTSKFHPKFQQVICNGPGTCIPVCLMVRFIRLFRIIEVSLTNETSPKKQK